MIQAVDRLLLSLINCASFPQVFGERKSLHHKLWHHWVKSDFMIRLQVLNLNWCSFLFRIELKAKDSLPDDCWWTSLDVEDPANEGQESANQNECIHSHPSSSDSHNSQGHADEPNPRLIDISLRLIKSFQREAMQFMAPHDWCPRRSVWLQFR